MPHRRPIAALPLALLAPLLLAGCEVELAPGAIPAPISIEPTPSASAGVPKYVCSATYKILTEGAVRLAEQTATSAEPAAIKRTFTDMAARVDDELTRTTDPGLRDALKSISDDGRLLTGQADDATGTIQPVVWRCR